jgi:hypothetical protein
MIESDPACEYIIKPDQDVERFFSHTYINHYGMRSEQVPATRSAETLRILFVGDSITYGTSRVDQRSIFTELLHQDLPKLVHRPVEVLNASAGGWAPDNEVSFLRSRGIFHSDIVFLVLNDGDVTQPRSTISQVGDDLPQTRPSTAISELFTRFIKPRLLHLVSKKDAGITVGDASSKVIDQNLADLDIAREMVEGNSARLVLLYIPFRRDLPQISAHAQSTLHAWANARHITIFDLSAAELPYPAEQIDLQDGVHFNAKGHEMIAREIEKLWPQL